MTLSAYIARQRIDYASYLMKNTDRSMADIASECGFFDQSHFTKTFRAVEGMPPLRYRKKEQEQNPLAGIARRRGYSAMTSSIPFTSFST